MSRTRAKPAMLFDSMRQSVPMPTEGWGCRAAEKEDLIKAVTLLFRYLCSFSGSNQSMAFRA